MAILSRSELPGVSAAQIGPVITSLADQIKSFPGFIAHASGAIPGGYQVIEVWESQEAQERWIRETLMPALLPSLREMGIQQHPTVQYLPLDQILLR
ncbi:MAG: hypothetical protein ABI068_11180 [Ktedonobacterales bacterium]